MSLVELAERKQLPEFQFMDQETLDWIIANRPTLRNWEYRKGLFIYPFPISESPLEQKWFLEPKGIGGIHGTRHALRVAIHALALAKELGFPKAKQEAAMIAGLLHDVRRKDDKGDSGHGPRCAEWFLENVHRIALVNRMTEIQKSDIAAAIGFHESQYDQIDIAPEYVGREDIVDVLKAADALDRYRLPKLNWRIDETFLKVKPSDEFKAFAFDLVIASEKRFLAGDENASSVASAFKQITS
jgi:hypothetical protein